MSSSTRTGGTGTDRMPRTPEDLPRGGDRAPQAQRLHHAAGVKTAVALAGGVVVAIIAVVAGTAWDVTTLIGWDTAALIYMVWVWTGIWRMDAEHTARSAVRIEPGRVVTDIVLISAAVASLLAVGLVIVRAGNSSGAAKAAEIALVMASVVASWSMVHTTYTLRYARLYYTGDDGGISFNQDEPPGYSDFAYFAFTIGMTFQVSDTDVEDRSIRATALRHALLSYLFGAVILAATINLVAGLSK